MMKKLLATVAIAAVALSCFAAPPKGWTMGVGKSTVFRAGPGKDATGTQVYSFTIAYGSVLFDAKGKIVSSMIDELEIATPNYDGKSMPHFAGWPGTPGYNVFNHETEKVDGVSPNTMDSTAADINNWKSKRERGDNYGMNAKNDWYKQMDFFQKMFVGKTVDEVEAWYKKYTNDKNGRPLNPATTDAAEKAKYEALTAADKQVVADIRSGATMSINDPHGYVLAALKDAWKNRQPLATK